MHEIRRGMLEVPTGQGGEQVIARGEEHGQSTPQTCGNANDETQCFVETLHAKNKTKQEQHKYSHYQTLEKN